MKPQNALVFFDLDGTLLDKNHFPVASAAKAISQLRERGHLVFINTGRCMAMITQDILDVGFDGVIASCGAHIVFHGQTLHNVLIPQQLIKKSLDLMLEHHVDFWLEGPENVYLDTQTADLIHHAFVRFFRDYPVRIEDIRQDLILVNKFSYEGHAQSQLEPVLQFFREHFDLIEHRHDHGEVLPRGYSKATGIAAIKQHLRRPDALTFAFGDSLNDLDMLKFADFGIAMGGSLPPLIDHSDHVTDAPDDHGIENALRHYQLID